MLNRDRRRRILTLALPILGGMASQNVLNLVDTAMVGVLGAPALAAVGMASFINFMASAFVTGLSAGVQAMAARRKGEGRTDQVARPLNGGLLLAAALAVPWSLVLVWQAGRLFGWLVDDPEVVQLGTPYLQARLLAMVFLGANFAFRGYWNGVDLSTMYLRTIVTMHVVNVALNWVLIFGRLGFPELGVTGAGVGSAIATAFGTALYLLRGFRHARHGGFMRSIPDRGTMAGMLRLSVPAGLQQFFFASGMTAFFWIIGRVGTEELAASNVLVHLLLVAVLPGLGFGLASATLVGQALGRGDPDDARRWAWDVGKMAMVLVGLIALVGLITPRTILSLFLHDPETLHLATLPLQIIAATIAFDTLGMVLMHSLLGAGHNRPVMVVSIVLQWGLFLPVAYLVGPVLGGGMLAVWVAQVGYRFLQTLAFVAMWRRGRWAEVKV